MPNSKQWIQFLVATAFGGSLSSPSVLAFEESCGSQSDTRFALVIGNSYSGNRWVTGRRDAEVMARHLCQLEFSVDLFLDATLEHLEGDPDDPESGGALAQFRGKISGAKDVVFFYSGHGYQIEGENYLLPIDQAIGAPDPQLPLSRVLWALKGAPEKAVKIVFLDACRTLVDAPPDWTDGLAEPQDLPPTTLVSFAAEYGHAVPSGRDVDRHSPYSGALLRSIREPGLEIDELVTRVSREVAATQTPTNKSTGDFPDFYFKEAIKLPLTVTEVNDQLLVFHNGRFVLAAAREGEGVTLELNAGDNELLLMVFNAKNFESSQSWRPTDGWRYKLEVSWPSGSAPDCPNASPCFQGHEKYPFKAGPHHGQVFEVAKATIRVDPGDGSVRLAMIDTELWREKPPRWARHQDRLWGGALDTLGFEQRPKLRRLADVFTFLKTLLSALGISETVDLPELRTLFAEIYGNVALREPAEFCMGQTEERLADLEASLEIFFENSDPRPFDRFDEGLSACIEEWVSMRPDHPFFNEDDVRIWTALQDRGP